MSNPKRFVRTRARLVVHCYVCLNRIHRETECAHDNEVLDEKKNGKLICIPCMEGLITSGKGAVSHFATQNKSAPAETSALATDSNHVVLTSNLAQLLIHLCEKVESLEKKIDLLTESKQ